MQKDILQRLTRIDHLIRIKGTGTPVQLADKLGISERSVYDYLNLMKDFGAPIKFDTYRESYYYETEGHFLVSFLSPSAERKIRGNNDILSDQQISPHTDYDSTAASWIGALIFIEVSDLFRIVSSAVEMIS